MTGIHIRGEGGVIWAMALPLTKDHAKKLADGRLTRVNEDGSAYVAEPVDVAPPAPAEDNDPPVTPPAKAKATK